MEESQRDIDLPKTDSTSSSNAVCEFKNIELENRLLRVINILLNKLILTLEDKNELLYDKIRYLEGLLLKENCNPNYVRKSSLEKKNVSKVTSTIKHLNNISYSEAVANTKQNSEILLTNGQKRSTYSDDDYVEFQYEVIKIMRNLTRRNQASLQQQNYNYNTNRGYTTATPDYRIHEYQPTQLILSTSRMPQELMQQSSILTELSSITSPDYDFNFSKTP
ncbi:hypothetical protein FQR65_LT05340 [Abscondita terminalis]|nr:hypothetical protein FQR65_LT05340 [Abscondita terminalis]